MIKIIFARTLDERLYVACQEYCYALFDYVMTNDKISQHYGYFDLDEQRKINDMNKKHLHHRYEKLKEIINEIEGDRNVK